MSIALKMELVSMPFMSKVILTDLTGVCNRCTITGLAVRKLARMVVDGVGLTTTIYSRNIKDKPKDD